LVRCPYGGGSPGCKAEAALRTCNITRHAHLQIAGFRLAGYCGDMLNDIYNRKILGFAADIPRLKRLEHPDATAVAHSRLCGSKVTVDLAMKDGVITDFGHDVKACALGQASSSIMARHVVGSTGAEMKALKQRMHAMLKENGPPPDGRWAELEALTPVRDYKARHASTLLTFDAVADAVEQVEAHAKTDS
jgi:NifU-like protein involved in Fe-S cluster formation